MKPIRVLIVDDHYLVRAGIRSLVEEMAEFEVVGEASNGEEALKMIKPHHPDMVIMDISMEGMNGIEAAESISKEFPGIKTVILSMYKDEDYVVQALEAGAKAYLLKDVVISELELALRAVMRGESYLSPGVSKTLISDYLRRLRLKEQEPPSPANEGEAIALTPRQTEILKLIAEGKSNKEIARVLQISLKTVDNHRTQLMSRLDIHDVAGLVRYAIANATISSKP